MGVMVRTVWSVFCKHKYHYNDVVNMLHVRDMYSVHVS